MSDVTILAGGEICSCAVPQTHVVGSDIAEASSAVLHNALRSGTTLRQIVFRNTLPVRSWLWAAVITVAGVAGVHAASSPSDTAQVSTVHRIVHKISDVSLMPPVIVHAPSKSEWRVMMRRDTVARMLRRRHVDSTSARRWAHDFVMYGEQLHVNPKLLVAIAYAESEFNPRARSHAGAIGLMQVVPARSSWREYEPRCGRMSASSLHEPHTNICFGAHIYREFLTRHHGDTDHALAAYNNGSGELNGYPDRVYASLSMLRH